MPQFKIQQVEIEVVQKGRSSYEVANVTYTNKTGENKTKKVMSFANPGVFATVKKASPGTTIDVTYVEGDKYYNWASCTIADEDAPAVKPAAAGGKVLGSNYETAEERKIKQMYIIKQSSISNAITLLAASTKPGGDKIQVEDVLALAQEFVDFVYGNDFSAEEILEA
jgi:hypothetical protein